MKLRIIDRLYTLAAQAASESVGGETFKDRRERLKKAKKK